MAKKQRLQEALSARVGSLHASNRHGAASAHENHLHATSDRDRPRRAARDSATAVIGVSRADTDEVLGPKFLTLEKVGVFKEPVHLSQPPGVDSPLFVVERAGTVRVIDGGGTRRRPVPRPAPVRQGHRARAANRGCSRSPSRPSTPRAPSSTSPTPTTATRSASSSSPAAPTTRSSLTPPARARYCAYPSRTTKHHGGLLLFGPDKSLYIGSGDSGPSGDPGTSPRTSEQLLGKILRIDPRPPRTPLPRRRAARKRAAARRAAAKRRAAKGETGAGGESAQERERKAARRTARHPSRSRPPTRSRRTTRSSAGPGATRSSPTACATRGASPSTTARSATSSRSATSATNLRRGQHPSVRQGARRELRLVGVRGARPVSSPA